MKLISNLLKLALTLVSTAFSKVVIVRYKQQIVLMDQVPKINTSLVIRNDGAQNVQDFQLILPNEKVGLISHIDAEDGFGNPLKYEITESEMDLEVKQELRKFTFINFEFGEPLGSNREITVNIRFYIFGKYEFSPAEVDMFVSRLLLGPNELGRPESRLQRADRADYSVLHP